MKFSFATLLLAGVSQVLAVPTNTTLSTRDNLTCGTTSNAVTSDCKKLLDSDFSLNYGRGHTCSYYEDLVWRRVKAYNPVCWGPGNCCIYTMGKGYPSIK
ncbi:hypothetical protein BD779DRAFT_1672024 [Infundibulicybe gibba]|nr:hypothetical protein BD779DRAFT_1672024 [Infundibulicybe gibba]